MQYGQSASTVVWAGGGTWPWLRHYHHHPPGYSDITQGCFCFCLLPPLPVSGSEDPAPCCSFVVCLCLQCGFALTSRLVCLISDLRSRPLPSESRRSHWVLRLHWEMELKYKDTGEQLLQYSGFVTYTRRYMHNSKLPTTTSTRHTRRLM
jgi:hypothetical protein